MLKGELQHLRESFGTVSSARPHRSRSALAAEGPGSTNGVCGARTWGRLWSMTRRSRASTPPVFLQCLTLVAVRIADSRAPNCFPTTTEIRLQNPVEGGFAI